jgi:muconolactone delta-isomerase
LTCNSDNKRDPGTIEAGDFSIWIRQTGDWRPMKVSKKRSAYSPHEWTTGAFNLPRLVSIIGFKLTAYIGGATTTQSVVDWLRSGLPADIEPRMRAAFDISNPIADAESGLIAQGFLIRIWEETGSYRTPAGMLREADVGVARQLLTRLAAAEYLSNEVANIEDVAVRLQEWINDAELPDRVGYTCQLSQGRRLSLTLVHSNFPADPSKWDDGVDWPCWDQIIPAVPEMASARLDIDFTTGCPFRYLRSRHMLKTIEVNAAEEI